MSKLQLAGALTLIAVVVGSQLVRHDHNDMDGHGHAAMAMSPNGTDENGYATVHLAVTGMT